MLDKDARKLATERSVTPMDVLVHFGRIHKFDQDLLLSHDIGDVSDVTERDEPRVVAARASRPSGAYMVDATPGQVQPPGLAGTEAAADAKGNEEEEDSQTYNQEKPHQEVETYSITYQTATTGGPLS